MNNFKEGHTEILVATDVAARGLDFNDVTYVFNFDIPQDPDSYVHRIGRTGRVGKPGTAVTFVTPRELGHLQLIEQAIKKKIARIPIPTVNEALEGQQRLAIEKLMQVVEEGETHHFKLLAEELLNTADSVSLLSAALKLLTKAPDTTPVTLTEEKPFRQRKKFNKHKSTRPWKSNRRQVKC